MPHRDLSVLGPIVETADDEGIDLVLIGAVAREIMIEQQLGESAYRVTRDIDLVARVDSWEQFDAFLEEIESKTSLTRWGDHKLRDEQGVEIDIVPVGHIADAKSLLTWPKSGLTMSTGGLLSALATGERIDLGGMRLLVASVSSIVALKLFAYKDRRETTRKDLDDLIQVLDSATQVLLDRVYEEFGTEVAEIDFEDLGPTLIGRELVEHLPLHEREQLVQILDTMILVPPRYVDLTLAVGSTRVPGAVARFTALRQGLDSLRSL